MQNYDAQKKITLNVGLHEFTFDIFNKINYNNKIDIHESRIRAGHLEVRSSG